MIAEEFQKPNRPYRKTSSDIKKTVVDWSSPPKKDIKDEFDD